jgi:hypothetical protein
LMNRFLAEDPKRISSWTAFNSAVWAAVAVFMFMPFVRVAGSNHFFGLRN